MKGKILVYIDSWGWCADQSMSGLANVLRNEYDITIKAERHLRRNPVTEGEFKEYDRVLLLIWKAFYMYEKHRKLCYRHRDKLLVNVVNTRYPPLSILPHFLSCFRAVGCQSLEILGDMKEYHRSLHYVPWLVDTDFYKPTKTERSPMFTVGWAGNEKNKLKNLELRDAIFEDLDDVILKKAGKGLDIKFYDREDLSGFYSSCDVLIVTSKKEGGPVVGFEAMSCGVPVISTRVGNMPRVVEDGVNGFLVEGSVEPFREKIMYLKDNPEELKRMKINARRRILERWTWNEFKDRWIHFLEA